LRYAEGFPSSAAARFGGAGNGSNLKKKPPPSPTWAGAKGPIQDRVVAKIKFDFGAAGVAALGH
jgi:hypothetical protein